MPKSVVASSDEAVSDFFERKNFGHDLPVWIRNKRPVANTKKRPRIMFIAQDPKRVNDPKGSVHLSSPFGVHSKDFRENATGTPRLEVAIFNALMEGERAEIYVTDRLKFYADSPGYVERNEKILQAQKDFLEKEVRDYFKPSTIVIFGEKFARCIWPKVFNPKGYKHLGASGFSELVGNEPWRGEWLGESCLVFLHPSRQNAQLMRKRDEEIIAYYVEGIKGALHQC